MFNCMEASFDLPKEIKQHHNSPQPYRSYNGKNSAFSFSGIFGIDHVFLSQLRLRPSQPHVASRKPSPFRIVLVKERQKITRTPSLMMGNFDRYDEFGG
ncbi:hypothetical protein JHK87_014524 [Glycine soja]|nr:hypothetical protein JHK87_014524 [Glycine soja]